MQSLHLFADMQKLVGGIPDGVNALNTSHDHDRDKYKRRPPMQWLMRWFRYLTFLSIACFPADMSWTSRVVVTMCTL